MRPPGTPRTVTPRLPGTCRTAAPRTRTSRTAPRPPGTTPRAAPRPPGTTPRAAPRPPGTTTRPCPPIRRTPTPPLRRPRILRVRRTRARRPRGADGYPSSAGPAPEPAPGEGSGNTGPARPAETARRPATAREDGAAVAGPAAAGSDPGRGLDRHPPDGALPRRPAPPPGGTSLARRLGRRVRGDRAPAHPHPAARPPADGGEAAPLDGPEAIEARAAQHRRGDEPHGGLDLAPSRTGHGSAGRPPTSGWRRWVYVLTGGLVNPGESPAELHRRDLVARANRPLISSHKIAMLSLKGGVGKTTVTATLGATFASHRGDRVVAVDANPDRGTLSQKIPLETTATVRHLLRDADRVRRYSDVRAYTSQGVSRLEVLASEQDPAVSEAFSEDDYRRAVDLLEHFYNLVLTDCGTGLMHSAMYGVLGMADQIVVVSSGSIDGARSASATLDWLDAHGYGALVRNAVVVINTVYRRAGGGVDLDRVAEHFSGRCRAVVKVPFDPHLEEGAEIDLERLEETTRTALLELAAAVADGFPV
ncbi:AAA family ATPase [Pseudonocardia alni]|nr:AAA family ATPase [Pseudonocardia alni]